SFGEKDLVTLHQYQHNFSMDEQADEEKTEKRNKKREEKGLSEGASSFKNMSIKLDGNKYIVDAYGYHQVFTKISDSLIRDKNGIEYHKIMDEYDHSAIRWIDENRKKDNY